MRHDEKRKLWKPGQIWETRNDECEQWVPVGYRGRAEPLWDERQEYRALSDASSIPAPTAAQEELYRLLDSPPALHLRGWLLVRPDDAQVRRPPHFQRAEPNKGQRIVAEAEGWKWEALYVIDAAGVAPTDGGQR